MQNQYSEVVWVIVAGIVLGLVLVGFIITMLVAYRKKQYQHEQELLHARLEIQENIFKNLSEEIHDNIGQELSVLKLTLSVIPVHPEEDAAKYIKESRPWLIILSPAYLIFPKACTPIASSKLV